MSVIFNDNIKTIKDFYPYEVVQLTSVGWSVITLVPPQFPVAIFGNSKESYSWAQVVATALNTAGLAARTLHLKEEIKQDPPKDIE